MYGDYTYAHVVLIAADTRVLQERGGGIHCKPGGGGGGEGGKG